MQSPPLFLLLLLLLLPTPSSSSFSHRRILHQPFFPDSSSPPPSPSPPSKPFSSNSPFFPLNPSPPSPPSSPTPPPPPSPLAYASFPANISSLILPHSSNSSPSKSSSSKLTLAAIVSVSAALALLSFSLFVVLRRRRSQRKTRDLQRSDLSSSPDSKPPGEFTRNVVLSNANRTVLRSAVPTPSSEFLYLGNVANSRAGGEGHLRDATPASRGLDPRKLDSPDLQPLPPLARQGTNSGEVRGFERDPAEIGVYRGNQRGGREADGTTEEEEEFYSPRVSLEGRESSIGIGSSSRRAFMAVEGSETMTLGDDGSRRKSVSSSSSSRSS